MYSRRQGNPASGQSGGERRTIQPRLMGDRCPAKACEEVWVAYFPFTWSVTENDTVLAFYCCPRCGRQWPCWWGLAYVSVASRGHGFFQNLDKQRGTVRVADLYEKISKRGNRYFVGPLK